MPEELGKIYNMRSYDGESSSGEEDDKREVLPEVHLQPGPWQRSHPTWAWDHRSSVRIYITKFQYVFKKKQAFIKL